MKQGNEGKKIGAGILFVAACFIAAFVLVEFHKVYIAVALAGILLLVSAYFLLTALLEKKVEEWSKPLEEEEETPSNKEAEFREQIIKYLESSDRTQRAMFVMVKRSLETQETSLAELEKAVEKLAAEQSVGVKTLVKYNKENARQLAINERESISELKKSINDVIEKNAGTLRDALKEGLESLAESAVMAVQAAPAVEAELSIEEPVVEEAVPENSVVEEPAAEEVPVVEEIVQTEPVTEPEVVAEEVVEAEPVTFEETVIPEPAEEVITPEPVEEEAPAFDPNATLSPEDIAKLFAAAQETVAEPEVVAEEVVEAEPVTLEETVISEPAEEVITPEPVEEEEPAFDPNATLSPEDIAKLFASMGS